MIRNIDGSFDFGGGTKFGTLTELVDHYRENPMVEKNGGTVLHLKHVCCGNIFWMKFIILSPFASLQTVCIMLWLT